MRKTSSTLRSGALGALLLTTTALTVPVFGQTAPAHRAVDANGVDLISGTFPFNFAEGSIGSGEGMLSLERNGASATGLTNWEGVFAYQTISGAVTSVVISLGDRSERFTSTSGGPFVPAQANGATLVNFVYTDADGVSIAFGAGADDQGGASNFCGHIGADQSNCYALPLSITRPNTAATSFTWDVRSHCATVFNPDGGLDCAHYWRLGQIANSFGYAIDFSYVTDTVAFQQPPSGNWFKRDGATLSNGGTTRSVSYNFVSSTVTEITDANARTWRLTTGTNSLGIRRPGSSSDDISVTLSGGIVTQVVRDGITTGYSRAVSGNTATTTITAGGNSTVVSADTSIARVTQIVDPLSRITGYQYDGSGRLTRITMPEGNYVNYTYDSRGNLIETRTVAKSGSGLSDIVTSATYAESCDGNVACNQPLTTTDARGYVTNYAYDEEHGGLLSVTAPAPSGSAPSGSGDRPQVRYSYEPAFGETGPLVLAEISACASGTAGGSPDCVGTANEAVTELGYDGDGNVNSVTRRNGNSTVTSTVAATYDGDGNLLTVDGPLAGTGDTTRYRYNSAGEQIGAAGPDPDSTDPLKHRARRINYDSAGRVSSVEEGTVNSQSDGDWASFAAAQRVEQDYAQNRPTVTRLMSGSTTYSLTQTSYDSLGRVQCVAQRMNSSEFASLPSDACTLDTEGSHGPDRITRYYYDAAGQLTQARTAYAVSGQEANEATLTYSNNGLMTSLTDAMGNRTRYEFNGHDRLAYVFMPSPTQSAGTSSTTDYEAFAYDAAGNTTSWRNRSGAVPLYTYDNLNRLTLKNLPGSELDVTYEYDLLGRLTEAETSSQTLAFTWDALGRNLTQTGPLGTATSAYDADGRRTRLTYPGSGLYVDYEYTVAGQLRAIRENGASSGAGVLAIYSYDDLGRRTQLLRGNNTITTYGYDAVSRQTSRFENFDGSGSDLTLGLSYNPAGQIAQVTRSNDAYAWGGHYAVTRGYTANGLNQYTAAGAVTPTYDTRGNVTAAGAGSYDYLSENRLEHGPGGAALVYDPLGRLYFSYSTALGGTWLASDGNNVIAEYDNSIAVQRRYVFGPGTDELLVTYEGSGTSSRRWYHQDERGSVIALSNATALPTSINSYDEFGIPASTNIGRFQYTGQQWLAEFGMQHSRNRVYSPTLGRFMQTDPIGVAGGINLYAYVWNDPVNLVDPFGLSPPTPEECRDDPDNCVFVDGPGSTRSSPRILIGGSSTHGPRMVSTSGNGGAGPSRPPSQPPRPRPPRPRLPARPTDLCEGMRVMQNVGNDMMAGGGAIALAGLATPLVPDGEVVGVIVMGLGGLAHLQARGARWLMGCS